MKGCVTLIDMAHNVSVRTKENYEEEPRQGIQITLEQKSELWMAVALQRNS